LLFQVANLLALILNDLLLLDHDRAAGLALLQLVLDFAQIPINFIFDVAL